MKVKFCDGVEFPLKNAKLKGDITSSTETVSRSDRKILELMFDKAEVTASDIEQYFVDIEEKGKFIAITDDNDETFIYPDFVIPKSCGTEYPDDMEGSVLVMRVAQLNDIDKTLRAIGPVTKVYTGSELEIAIAKKHDEIARDCKKAIHAGITVDFKQYSLTEDDQQNISVLKDVAKMGYDVPYHADGEPCRPYSAEEFLVIYSQAMQHITNQTTYCNLLIRYTETLESVDAVNEILYNVTKLPPEYEEMYYNAISLISRVSI